MPMAGQRLTIATAVAGAILAAAPLWLEVDNQFLFWAARVFAVCVIIALWVDGPRGGIPDFLAPATLIAGMVLVLYVLFPALAGWAWFGPPLPIPAGGDPFVLRYGENPRILYVQRMLASDAERAVLAFVGFAASLATLWRLLPATTRQPDRLVSPWPLVLGIVLAGGLYRGGKALLSAGSLSGGFLSFVDILPGLALLATALLVQGFIADRRRYRAGLAVALMLLVLTLGATLIKTLVFFLSLVALIIFFTWRGRGRSMILLAMILVPMAGSVVLGVNRDLVHWDHLASKVRAILVSKLVERQAESVYCLHFAMETLDDGRAGSQPGYLLAALVPRLLWPEKPSLSNGADYARPYCGIVRHDRDHSASVTLLGEQVIMAGWPGIGVGGGVLAMLSLLTTLAWRRGGVAQAMVLALSPWLLDFDQHLAMYLANAAKLLMGMVLAYAVLSWWRGWRSAGQAP